MDLHGVNPTKLSWKEAGDRATEQNRRVLGVSPGELFLNKAVGGGSHSWLALSEFLCLHFLQIKRSNGARRGT